MTVNLNTDSIVIGDISKAWLVDFGVEVDNVFVLADLNDFTCRMSLVEKAAKKLIVTRPITQIHENQFVIYLSVEETKLLMEGCDYILMAQLDGTVASLPKPIKTTRQLEFRAVGGFIQ